MREIANKKESSAQRAKSEITDKQCVCCPKCKSINIEFLDGGFLSGELFRCNNCGIEFETRIIIRAVSPA